MKNEIENNEILDIKDMIYEIDGKEVMLDTDLAKLYQVETKRINEAVKNNPEKFPDRYYFRLNENEYLNLKSKISTSKGGSRKGHTAFIEQGIYMLATILKSDKAIEVSIRIMDTFVKMRHYINLNKYALPNRILLLEDKVDSNTKRIDELFDKFSPDEIIKDKLFFKGEFYDAYSKLVDILNKSKNEIIIIDNYISLELLNMLVKTHNKVVIVSKTINQAYKNKFEKQYDNVTFIKNNSFHDRFIIIDNKRLFVCGSSFKDIGKRCFLMDELHDKRYIERIVNIIKNDNLIEGRD